jgi:hypothetical protein
MATSADYLSSLITLAKNASAARKAAMDTALKQGASGTFAKDATGKTTYTPGTEGTLDVGYQRGSKNLEGSLESRGLLRSGEGATKRGDILSDYQRAVMGLYGTTEANKLAEDQSYLQTEGELKMKYGTGNEPTGAATPINENAPSMFQPQPDGTTKPIVNELTQAAGIALGSPMGTYGEPQKAQLVPQPKQTYDQAVGNVLYDNNVWNSIPFPTTMAPAKKTVVKAPVQRRKR